jgi:nucleoside-diphosphate-sugar epimerase
MNKNILILGYGAVGKATVSHLLEKGYSVTVAQRKVPKDLPEGVQFKPCDVLNGASVHDCICCNGRPATPLHPPVVGLFAL